MEKKEIRYRGEALNVISSPEQLDQHTKVIKAPAWILMLVLILAAVATGIWAFGGNISDGIEVRGTIFPQAGVTDIFTYSSGYVTSVLAKEGDFVEEGQLLAVVPNNEIIANIQKLREQVEQQKKTKNSTKKVQVLEDELNEAISEYESNSVIKSTVSGTVQGIVSKNEIIRPGDKLAAIINEDQYTNDKEVIAFIPLTVAQNIQLGMEAQVSPTFAPREKFGYMKGYITKVGRVPVTQEMLQKTFGNWNYAKSMVEDGGCVELRITLSIDPKSKNNFQWSNNKGHRLEVDTSTICDVLIVLENKRPIDLLLGIE